MIKNAGRIGNDHEKGERMKLEDTTLPRVEIKKEEIELSPFIPVTDTLLRTAAGEIGTEAEQKEAQRLVAKIIAGPIGKVEF